MTTSCAFCSGTGIQPHSLKMACLACRGKGKVEFEHAAIMCPGCKGSGRVSGFSVLSCTQCRGVGMIEKVQEVERVHKVHRVHRVYRKTIDKVLPGVVVLFKTVVHKMKGAGKWIKNGLIKTILWFKTIFHNIKLHL